MTKTKTIDDILYPSVSPIDTGHIYTEDGHEIYWEISGRPDGVPVMIFHGGPGGGSSPIVRRFFDPEHYMIIQHDQRGCGQSRPFGSLKNNSTEYLINDANLLANKLKIDSFHVFGGSWGSTLSLAYAQKHPERCLSLTLRGVFLMRQREIDWFMHGMGKIFPEAYQEFRCLFPHTDDKNLLEDFYQALIGQDENLKQKAARAWSRFESACCFLIPNQAAIDACDDDHFAYPIALLETHYFRNNRFQPDDALLKNVDKIKNIPTSIIQGRYDTVCPPVSAFDLKAALPHAELTIVPDAGHASTEIGIAAELVNRMDQIKYSA